MTNNEAQVVSERLEGLHWRSILWFTLVHILGLLGVWYAYTGARFDLYLVTSTFSQGTLVFTVVLFFAIQFSISMLAHRNYSHRAYVAGTGMQYVLLPFFAAAAQSPGIIWAPWHSEHHAYTDQDGDRHSPVRYGFFYAHMGWMCTKRGVTAPSARRVVQVRRHPKAREPLEWERRNHDHLAILVGFAVPTLVGAMFGDFIGGMLVGCFSRLVCNYHCTWIVNSVTHSFGNRIEGGGSATNAWWWLQLPLAIVSVGEANNHANHHKRPNAYIFGSIDPAGWAIWLCIHLGLAQERKPT